MLSALSLCSICSQRPTTTDAVVPWYNMVQPSNTIAINSSFSPPVPCSRKHGWSMVWLIHLVPRKMREHANRCQQLWDRIRLEFMESYCKQKWQRISSQGLSQINCGLLAAQGRTRGTKNPAKWPVHFRTPGPRYVYFIFISLKFKITQNTKKGAHVNAYHGRHMHTEVNDVWWHWSPWGSAAARHRKHDVSTPTYRVQQVM